ncbi:MAG TPA: hypothetical protein VNJ08_08540 [Bacteriovoracaceae bacterium]|nr:hypothetical protein [Bacteriovoracaceae bacterium]
MKKALTVVLLALGIFSANAQAQMGGYYYQQHQVQVQYSFVQYHFQPAMCVYQKAVPQWNRHCGIQAGQVSGCSYQASFYGAAYMCGTAVVQQTVCAWSLSFYPVNFVAACGSY